MKDYLTIATIVKPQGIRGEVKVISMTDSPEDLSSFNRVYIGGNVYKILKVRPQGENCAYLTLSGVADRNAAELFRGLNIDALREDAPALPENTYYIADVIGCKLVDDTGAEIGEVESITPAKDDIYEAVKKDGKRVVFPAVEGLIHAVDLSVRVITVSAARFKEVALDE